VSARAAASGLTIWASPARLKILIKKLRRSLLSVGGGLSLSGLSTSRGTVLRSRCSPHLAGAPIAPRVLDLRADTTGIVPYSAKIRAAQPYAVSRGQALGSGASKGGRGHGYSITRRHDGARGGKPWQSLG
jgi:hypothetical protein